MEKTEVTELVVSEGVETCVAASKCGVFKKVLLLTGIVGFAVFIGAKIRKRIKAKRLGKVAAVEMTDSTAEES